MLIGKGVTLDSIRPLAYSTLADLAHHVRQSLSLDVLEKAIKLFSKNVHDESLATGIQTMSCKLLLNLVDCVRHHSEVEPIKARSLLTTLLKVFVYKFQTIAKITLPTITQRLYVHVFVCLFFNNFHILYNSKSQTMPLQTSPTSATSSTTTTALENKENIAVSFNIKEKIYIYALKNIYF